MSCESSFWMFLIPKRVEANGSFVMIAAAECASRTPIRKASLIHQMRWRLRRNTARITATTLTLKIASVTRSLTLSSSPRRLHRCTRIHPLTPSISLSIPSNIRNRIHSQAHSPALTLRLRMQDAAGKATSRYTQTRIRNISQRSCLLRRLTGFRRFSRSKSNRSSSSKCLDDDRWMLTLRKEEG